MLVLKLFTIDTERINSLWVERWSPLCVKRPLHMKRQLPLPPGSTVLISSALIASTLIINHLYINHWSTPGPTVSITSALSIDHLYVDHWSAPGSTVLITSASISSMLITSMLIIDLPPQDQKCLLPLCQSSLCWLPLCGSLIHSPRINSVHRLCIYCLYVDHWSTPPGSSVDCLCVDRLCINCRLTPLQISTF